MSQQTLSREASVVSRALTGLGRNPSEVAESLRQRNVRGVSGIACACPIAVYVKHLLGRAAVSVGPESMAVNGDLIALPAPVAGFVCGFDRGLHSDLACSWFEVAR